MVFQIYIGKRKNSRGKVEISLRFRHGKFDQQAVTNLWIWPDMFDSKVFISNKGTAGERCTLNQTDGMTLVSRNEATEVAEILSRMQEYIEECFCMVRRKSPSTGWLAETIERFHAEELPRIEEERTEVVGLIDTYIAMTSEPESSDSRMEAYMLLRRSIARFEALRRIKFPRFRLFAGRMDESCLRQIQNFFHKEHVWVRKYPQIAKGPGLEGRTRPKGPNTVNDRMKLLKAVMRWAAKTRRIPGNPFDSFTLGQNVYGTPVYLTLEERRRIELHDFSSDPRLALQRDIFIFQCCVGCRVSDLMGLRADNVIDGELNYVARKTREGRPLTIKVPLNQTALTIVERYADPFRDSLFPEFYSRMGYNNIIKEILRKVGLTRRVVVIDPLTREPVCRKLYEIASSHMARRTFIGNIFKKFKDQNLVSELSGHTPGSHAFARYREIDTEIKREMVAAID